MHIHTHKGPTLTVAEYDNNGQLFGGYNDQSWTSPGLYRRSSVAFLFDSTHVVTATVQPQYAIFDGASYGPIFGGGHGHDWNTFSGTRTGSFITSAYPALTLPGHTEGRQAMQVL